MGDRKIAFPYYFFGKLIYIYNTNIGFKMFIFVWEKKKNFGTEMDRTLDQTLKVPINRWIYMEYLMGKVGRTSRFTFL